MERKNKFLLISIIGFIIISSSISTILIINFFNSKEKNVYIEFIPKEIKSYPNHTAWLILDISTTNHNLMSNLSISIKTNSSIEWEYKIWENENLRKVVEVFIYPNITHLENTIEIEATAYSEEISKKDYSKVQVVNWTIEISPTIKAMRDEFVAYLSNNHINFKINGSTVWEGFGNAPQILVVEHYLFKSAFWEMELQRHVTIYPHDWVSVYLRPRSMISPYWSGSINSWSSGNHTVIETEPPNEIYR